MGQTSKSNRAARATRFLALFFDVVFIVGVLTTTWAQSAVNIDLLICFQKKTIRAKLVKGRFAQFIQRDHHGIDANTYLAAKFYFEVACSLQQPSQVLKLKETRENAAKILQSPDVF